ncbi:hypothetical protein LCGC14_2371410 [marine sediment metagenome]|uniref:Uncharacterized protein n=1 Tax=marine sediment metagenome TaxID=412755 RepID=A0A0F9EG66_9ZZZZ
MPNLVITIERGVMLGVMTDAEDDSPVRIILIDYDNIEQGDSPNGAEFDLNIDVSQVAAIFAAYDTPVGEQKENN